MLGLLELLATLSFRINDWYVKQCDEVSHPFHFFIKVLFTTTTLMYYISTHVASKFGILPRHVYYLGPSVIKSKLGVYNDYIPDVDL